MKEKRFQIGNLVTWRNLPSGGNQWLGLVVDIDNLNNEIVIWWFYTPKNCNKYFAWYCSSTTTIKRI